MQHDPKILGMGFYWQDLEVGQKFVTFKRTITETDIINFISCTGMLETIFIDKTFDAGAISGRPVPGALTYGIIEGILMQSMVQGTGLALLEVHKRCWRRSSPAIRFMQMFWLQASNRPASRIAPSSTLT